MYIHLFPFELVKKNANVVVYGAGLIGLEYVIQNAFAGYCNIVAVLDRDHAEKTNFPVHVYHPEKIAEIRDYSLVIVALASRRHCEEARAALLELGVPREKILVTENRLIDEENTVVAERNPGYREADGDVFSLAVIGLGGLGDALVASSFIKEVRKTFLLPVRIDFYCGSQAFFKDSPFIDNVRSHNEFSPDNTYDTVIEIRRFAVFRHLNPEKLRRFSPLLHEYCLDGIHMIRNAFKHSMNDYLFTQYALLKGKNRMEQLNVGGIIPYDRNTPTYLGLDEAGFGVLSRHGLDRREYLVVCNAIESKQGGDHPKLWPNDYFEILLEKTKRAYPDIVTVHVGENDSFGRLRNIDLDLLGLTSPDELKAVMKHALLTVAVEGGILHLAHFLNGKAVGLFGPTVPKVFGYEENINLRCDGDVPCDNGCEHLTSSWLHGCLFGPRPKCMELLRPERVFDAVAGFLNARRQHRIRVGSAVDAPPDRVSAVFSGMCRDAAAGARVAHIGLKGEDAALAGAASAKCVHVFDRRPFESAAGMRMGEKCRAEYGNIYNIPARDGSYDVTTGLTLMDAGFPDLALREMLRITRPGGRVLAWMKTGAADAAKADFVSPLCWTIPQPLTGAMMLCIEKGE